MNGKTLLLATTALLPATVLATPTPPGVKVHHITQLSDTELGALRGRYVGAGGVTYFGVEMTTRWVNPSEQIDAGLYLGLSMAGPGQPQVELRPVLNVVSYADAAAVDTPPQNTAYVSNDSLGNIGGALQNIQVAGNYNTVRQDIELVVLHDAPAPASGATGTPGGVLFAQLTPGGTRVDIGADSTQIGLDLDHPDRGHVAQQIRGGTAQAGLLQSAQLPSDLNQVHNLMRITVVMPQNLSFGSAGGSFSPRLLQGLPGTF